MSEQNELHREACRRQHRTAANYLAMLAWCKGADCIVLDRPVMMRIFGVERFKQSRLEWLRDDMRPWFPKIQVMGRNTTAAVYLSRIDLDRWMSGSKLDSERVALMQKDGVSAILMDNSSSYECTEPDMVADLAMMATGLQPPAFDEKRERFLRQKFGTA
jgi:hypothetical protein